jgi:hypothetical protein
MKRKCAGLRDGEWRALRRAARLRKKILHKKIERVVVSALELLATL